jgi:hypothetical protein
MKGVLYCRNFLFDDDLSKLHDILNSIKFVPITKDNGDKCYWSSLLDNTFFTQDILKYIERLTEKKFKIMDVYTERRVKNENEPYRKKDDDNRYFFIMYFPYIVQKNLNFGMSACLKGSFETTSLPTYDNSVSFFSSNVYYRQLAPRQPRDYMINVIYELKEI